MIGLNLSPFGGKRSFGVASTLNNGLVGAWNADGNANAYIGNNGTLGANVTATGTAKVGTYSFRSLTTGQQITFPNDIWSLQTFTWAFWLYYDTTNLTSQIIVTWNTGPIRGYRIGLKYNYNDSLFIDWYDSAEVHRILETPLNSVSSGTWVHGVFSRLDGTRTRIYLNGTLSVSNTTTQNIYYPSTGLACYFLHPGSTTALNLDAIQLWNKELTAAEVTELYNTATGKQPPF